MSKEELVAAGCKILDEGYGKIIVSCPKERLEKGLVVKEEPVEIKRVGKDAVLTFRKES